MSRKEGRPRRAFSLLYLATQELDASLSSATAEATLGSFLSIPIVDLTLFITAVVSFTYSSSSAAKDVGGRGISTSAAAAVATALIRASLRVLVIRPTLLLVVDAAVQEVVRPLAVEAFDVAATARSLLLQEVAGAVTRHDDACIFFFFFFLSA